MKASETKLQRIVEGINQYVVPLFQRSYSWDAKEWDTLWVDLLELCEDEQPRGHFIGSIVTMPTQSVPEGVTKYLLIDGQQRLTTVFILLAVLRDRAKALPGTLAAQIDELLLKNRYQEGLDEFKLLPTQVDRESFIAIMRGEPVKQEDQLLKAYRFFDKRVRASAGIDLDALRKIIVGNLILVSIVLDRDDNPHLIFESLNAKGRPLSQADLIRNYFFMRIHVAEQERTYSTHWKPMQERLGDNLTEYIRHFLMKDGALVKQGDVYFALKKRADDKSQDEIIAYLSEITKFASYYSKLLHPDEESNAAIRERLERLNRIEVTTAYPFLLNIYDDFTTTRVSEANFGEVLDVLENFAIRRFVCGVPTYGLNKVFPPLYAQAAGDRSLVNGMKEALRGKNYPRDAEFRERLMSSKLYGPGERQVKTKLILERIEASFQHHEPVPFNQLTIEHVLPQTPTEWWKGHLGDDWEVIHDLLLHTIGNLTLTGYNPTLSNDDFPQKRALLADSHLELNKQIATFSEWNEASVRSRAEALAASALQVWPYFGAVQEECAASSHEVTGKAPAAVIIVGQRFAVSYWRDVAQRTLEVIAELDADLFEQIASQFPRFVGKDSASFRSSRQLFNGAFMETNLSASAIYRLCVQVSESAGLSSDDWHVEYT